MARRTRRRSPSLDAQHGFFSRIVFGELRRMARTSGAVGGIAARVAGERCSASRPTAPHMRRTCDILGGLKGPLMKVAQFLSTVPDALPADMPPN